ncbi:MAG: adenylosuccinate lyase [Puniceicoccaceae bacterium]|nr:MAG: adenylosuccinate lyase [Puniceicoccaceae bacterium]
MAHRTTASATPSTTGCKPQIENVLAQRYASDAMCRIWSPEGRVVMERDLWIAVLKAQRELGLAVPEGAVAAFEQVRERVDLASIARREAELLHDVKARLEEFCALAGFECLHLGMTSRDLTENVEQLQIWSALKLIRLKAVAVLGRLAARSAQWSDLVVTARTHNVPAQPTTLGKRLAMFGEELLHAVRSLDGFITSYPFRGLKGAVGTQLDLLTLFDGDAAKVAELEAGVLAHLGAGHSLKVVGQVYPRSLDAETMARLLAITSGPSSLAKTLRLMAGQGLLTEGFLPGQVGSSAMPHKVNARNCERINGFHQLLRGYAATASGLAGDQWNEGDVSCSVVRRVILPDAFFAADGLLETMLTVLDRMEVFGAAMAVEAAVQAPFLSATTLLMEAVKAGAPREEAHREIKRCALAAARRLREGQEVREAFVQDLLAAPGLGFSRERVESILERSISLTGGAADQVVGFVSESGALLERFPEAKTLAPGPLL